MNTLEKAGAALDSADALKELIARQAVEIEKLRNLVERCRPSVVRDIADIERFLIRKGHANPPDTEWLETTQGVLNLIDAAIQRGTDMTDTQDLIARLRLGASISRDRNLNLDFAKVADEAADALEAAQAEIERLKAITFEPGELAAHGIKTPTPMAFGEAITKRLNDKWGSEVAKLKERLTNQEFWVADAIKEKDAALSRLAESQAEVEKLRDQWVIDKLTARLAELEAGASPQPTELQAENDKLITALAACRDAFPAPDAGSELDGWYVGAMADPLEVPEYVKACLAVQPSQAGEPDASAKTWCEYVAGMVGCYLGEPVESDKCKAIAGIIGRRLWALPMPSQAGELSEAEIYKGWQQTFSTENPFCPCNLKSFTKSVNWAIAAINAKGAK